MRFPLTFRLKQIDKFRQKEATIEKVCFDYIWLGKNSSHAVRGREMWGRSQSEEVEVSKHVNEGNIK